MQWYTQMLICYIKQPRGHNNDMCTHIKYVVKDFVKEEYNFYSCLLSSLHCVSASMKAHRIVLPLKCSRKSANIPKHDSHFVHCLGMFSFSPVPSFDCYTPNTQPPRPTPTHAYIHINFVQFCICKSDGGS